jgi:hypothetical protein
MAATFKNARAALDDTTPTVVYTCPSATTAIVLGAQVANVSAGPQELDFWWTDASDTDQITYLAETVVVPADAAYEPIGGKLVLEAGDTLTGLSETTDELEVTVSVLELT